MRFRRVAIAVGMMMATACGARTGADAGDEAGTGTGTSGDTQETGDGDGDGDDPTAHCMTAEHASFDTPTGFPPACDPTLDDLPDGYRCCSDDPSAPSGSLPGYTGRYVGADTATPIFSGSNNTLSRWGLCVQEGLVPPGLGLGESAAQGCPVPCNPRWSAQDVDKICGANTLCCQTQLLGPDDCVLDAGTGCWRPATGMDVFDNTVQGTTFPQGSGDPWAPTTHDTHQDPGGTSCTIFAAGDATARNDCFSQLTVADQRGHCLPKSATVTACPLASPAYIDPCEQLNLDEGRDGC